MAIDKPSIPRGTRDFGPEKMHQRLFIFNAIRQVFTAHGFQPLETPAMENLSVLTGKYGDEGDQLMFKVLNSGNFLDGVDINDSNHKSLTPKIAEKALRYDLTVPFARYVAMNKGEIIFPFKRYQIQPVWRADRPQKGRYREFYQCDADVVGTDSLLCEQELIEMAHTVMHQLGIIDFSFKINNRKVLSGIAEAVGEKGKEGIICTGIDKVDKIGEEGVRNELLERGIANDAIENLLPIIKVEGTNQHKFEELKQLLKQSAVGIQGLTELEKVFKYVSITNPQHKLYFDPALARGLSYYTGAIFEIKANGVQIGSISGGGRYDNLTGVFGLPNVSGVGISFGIDRIYDVLEELKLFPNNTSTSTKVLIAAMDDEATSLTLKTAQSFRTAGIATEIYPEIGAKLKKQLNYADHRKVPFVVIIGSEETHSGQITLKNLQQGEQYKLSAEEAIKKVTSIL